MVGPEWQFQMSDAKLLLERRNLLVLPRHRGNGLPVSNSTVRQGWATLLSQRTTLKNS
jgi:hypothetical protein